MKFLRALSVTFVLAACSTSGTDGNSSTEIVAADTFPIGAKIQLNVYRSGESNIVIVGKSDVTDVDGKFTWALQRKRDGSVVIRRRGENNIRVRFDLLPGGGVKVQGKDRPDLSWRRIS